jgi:hypothetical protein
LFTRGSSLTVVAWQIGLTIFFVVCTGILTRACRADLREARAIDVAREVKDKTLLTK